jgi:hypothetical protein
MSSKEVNCTGITSKFFEKRKYKSSPIKSLSTLEHNPNTMKIVRSTSFDENINPLVSSKCRFFFSGKEKIVYTLEK